MRRRSLILLALLVGCQSVTVHSAPYGADVFVDGELVVTPNEYQRELIVV